MLIPTLPTDNKDNELIFQTTSLWAVQMRKTQDDTFLLVRNPMTVKRNERSSMGLTSATNLGINLIFANTKPRHKN